MLAYHIVFIVLGLLAISERNIFFGHKNVPILISVVIVILFTSLRGDVGQDTSNYMLIYDNLDAHLGDGNNGVEIGFYFFAKVIRGLGGSFNVFLFFTAIFSLSFYFWGLYQLCNAKYIIFAFMILFCDIYMYFNFSGLRQGIALSICLLSAHYALNKRIGLFLLCIMLAFMFHKSSLIALLIYPLVRVNIRYGIKLFVVLMPLIIAWVVFLQRIMSDPSVMAVIKGGEMYMSQAYNDGTVGAYVIGLGRRGYLLAIAVIFRKKIFENYHVKAIFNVYFFGFIFYAVNYPFVQDVSVRLSSYFILFEPVLLVLILLKLRYEFNRLLIFFVVVFIVFYKLFTYASLESYQYHFINNLI